MQTVLPALCLAAIGIWGSLGPFWALATRFLRGTAAAAGIAIVNSVGALAGFVAPYAIGWVKESTGGFGGLLVVAGRCFVARFSSWEFRVKSIARNLPARDKEIVPAIMHNAKCKSGSTATSSTNPPRRSPSATPACSTPPASSRQCAARGRVFRLDQHLARLRESCEALFIPLQFSDKILTMRPTNCSREQSLRCPPAPDRHARLATDDPLHGVRFEPTAFLTAAALSLIPRSITSAA